jgi:hypothetical protein
LVDYEKLHERLLATGKSFGGEAVLMIEHIVKTDEIEHTEQYHVYRRAGNLASPN